MQLLSAWESQEWKEPEFSFLQEVLLVQEEEECLGAQLSLLEMRAHQEDPEVALEGFVVLVAG